MNFLLFLPDAVRAESLGTYGNPIAKSPAFDKLAAQGTLFRQAHTLAPAGTPSRVAMATARYVHTKNHRTTQHLVQSWESNLFGLLHDQVRTSLTSRCRRGKKLVALNRRHRACRRATSWLSSARTTC